MKCLICYEKCETEYHESCIKSFFKTKKVPLIEYTFDELNKLSEDIIKSKIVVPGVQPKLSLHIEDTTPNRLTIIGFKGDFILKPPTTQFKELPENEDVTMHLAKECGLKTVPHILIKIKSGELCYLTKRIDRINNKKIHMEDFAQILEKLTEDKYKGSMEKIGKAILAHSNLKGIDLIEFFEISVFSYLVGNSDMHLKNFSIIENEKGYSLAPAYDLVSVKLAMSNDTEEMALPLNGKKNKLKISDFSTFAKAISIPEKSVENSLNKFKDKKGDLIKIINKSFLCENSKNKYIEIINQRFKIFQEWTYKYFI